MSADVLPLKRRRKNVYQDVEGIPYLKLNRESGVFYVRKYKAGKGELFKSTGEALKGRARVKADLMIAQWLGQKRLLPDERLSVEEIGDELRGALQQEFENGDRRFKTWDHDQTYIPIIQQLFGRALIDEVNESYWEDWVRTEGRKLRRDLFDIAKYLSKFLTYAHRKGYINRKPVIRNPDTQKRVGRVYEAKEIRSFIDHAEPLLQDLIILGAECGLRPSENRELRWEYVKFERRAVVICLPASFTKTKSEREFQVGKNSAAMLRRRFEVRDRSCPFVFPSPKDSRKPLNEMQLSRMWKRMRESAQITERVKFHWLRHSFYTKALLDKRLPVMAVAAYGGTAPNTLYKALSSHGVARGVCPRRKPERAL